MQNRKDALTHSKPFSYVKIVPLIYSSNRLNIFYMMKMQTLDGLINHVQKSISPAHSLSFSKVAGLFLSARLKIWF